MKSWGVLPAVLVLAAACGSGERPATGARGGEPAAAGPAAPAERTVILFLGDSLTAGYGVAMDEAYPALLARRWEREGIPYRARNAGVSGSTTKGVLENLDWHLAGDVRAVFLCIGANDGLRGQNLAETKANIDAIAERVRASGRGLVLAGMRVPPNYGEAYSEEFAAIFPAIAKKRGVPLLPFLLKGVGGVPEMNIADGIHPNAAGHREIARTVHAFLDGEGLLK